MSESSPPPRRLNPFAFPPETNVRFVLLIAAALALAVRLATVMRYAIFADAVNPFAEPVTLPSPDLPGDVYLAQAQLAYSKLAVQAFSSLGLPAFLVTLTFIITFALYLWHPSQVRRRGKLTALTPERDPLVHERVQSLAKIADIPPPIIETNNSMREGNGQAFGLHGHYSIRLDGGLRQAARSQPETFRAIVLHELAHIANSDINRTYFSQALWLAVITAVLLPLTLSILGLFMRATVVKAFQQGLASLNVITLLTVNIPEIGIFLLQTSAILSIILMIRAGLLRAREVYADWRAALWGAAEPLKHILQNAAAKEKRSNPFTSLWRLHPTNRERLNLLENPNSLFGMASDIPLIAGVLVAIMMDGAFTIFFPLTLGVGGMLASIAFYSVAHAKTITTLWLIAAAVVLLEIVSIFLLIAPVLGIAYLLAWSVGLQTQKQAVAESARRERGCLGYVGLWGTAAVITAGIELGILITPINIFTPRSIPAFLLLVPWWIVATFFTWLWLSYARYFGKRLLGKHSGSHPPQWKQFSLNILLSVIICAFYIPLFASRVFLGLNLSSNTSNLNIQIVLSTASFALFAYLSVFGATWIFVQITSFLFPSRCPSCKQIHHGIAVGQSCKHCGSDLANWLFIDQVIQSTEVTPVNQPSPTPHTDSPL